MADNHARRASVVERLIQRPAQKVGEATDESPESLKQTRLAISTPMLDVIFKDGRIRSFNYSYLREVDFEPGDLIILKFSDKTKVTIDGRNLKRHRQQIRLHRADEIHEGTEGEAALKTEDEEHISRIEITEGEDL